MHPCRRQADRIEGYYDALCGLVSNPFNQTKMKEFIRSNKDYLSPEITRGPVSEENLRKIYLCQSAS